MARGGVRPGAGRPKGAVSMKRAQAMKEAQEMADASGSKTPLEYMLAVMNDDRADEVRRDRMAMAAAPFVHARAGEQGKKDAAGEAAKKAASGKFGASAPPRLAAANGKRV